MAYDLDQGVEEYFEFVVKGHKYRFRHMNSEEVSALKKMDMASEETNKHLYTFVTGVDDAPPFEEVAKTMTIPNWRKFGEMIKTEMGANR